MQRNSWAAPRSEAERFLDNMTSRADEATAVAVAMVLRDGTLATAFLRGDDWARLVGAVAVLQARLIEPPEDTD